ncbi:MAG: oxygen-independent coproporphyrinogen-3 oxidase [Rhodothermales bacterium]|jgi:oxygen-independent coproporphyrinogen-3 oxidase
MLHDLYVHVPFCAKRCDYCAFYTLAEASSELRGRYVTRLLAEFAELAARCGPLTSVYLGGGTPSHLTPVELQMLFNGLHRNFTLAPDAEFSMEANPLSLTPQKLEIMQSAGVNRVSLGVQSFSARTREAIGRYGDVNKVTGAVALLRSSGVRSFNCDLIYATPGQTMAELDEDLARFVELAPPHVSTYSLMIEPKTPLAIRKVSEADGDLIADMWERINTVLGDALGLERYEISNLARPGHACRHNVGIWYGAPFAGAGPAACWFDGETRWANVADIAAWESGTSPEPDRLPEKDRAIEILTTGLRLAAGWKPAEFAARTGFDYQELRSAQLASLVSDGVLEMDAAGIRPTMNGLLLHDHIGRTLLA